MIWFLLLEQASCDRARVKQRFLNFSPCQNTVYKPTLLVFDKFYRNLMMDRFDGKIGIGHESRYNIWKQWMITQSFVIFWIFMGFKRLWFSYLYAERQNLPYHRHKILKFQEICNNLHSLFADKTSLWIVRLIRLMATRTASWDLQANVDYAEFLQPLMWGAKMAGEAEEIRWEWLYVKISE